MRSFAGLCCFVIAAAPSCTSPPVPPADETAIRSVNQQYVQAWLAGDEQGVLSLFENGAVITPGGMCPKEGRAAMESFWFPKDSSVTTIHDFTSQVLEVGIDGDLAQSVQQTFLSWSYEKGETKMARDQTGYALTIYRRQGDNSWKIWKQMWTDVQVTDK